MKSIVLPIVMVLLFSGCINQQQPSEESQPILISGDAGDTSGHIGCQEGEINEDGYCIPSNENNAELFGRDLDTVVESAGVDEGVTGFLAKPKTPGYYPGVVMIHEWWGLNDNIKEMARILAGEGYVVFAIDLYDGEVASDSIKARELATSVRNNPEDAIQKMRDAVRYLKETENVVKVASLGWCFGGQQSLQLSLNEGLDATVIYYGQLVTDKQELTSISGPVLGIFGAEDSSIPVAQVKEFESSLNDLGVENEIHIYPGVGHAFANPSGSNYAKEETIDAWGKTLSFLNKNLKVGDVDESPELVTFSLTGENYRFLMDGIENPTLRVRQGDKVRIEFTSSEGFHDWVLDEFDAATEKVRAVDSTSVEFTATSKGTFEYYCSVGQHRQLGMKGKLIVE
jgi:carboxymethylenebutenolidase